MAWNVFLFSLSRQDQVLRTLPFNLRLTEEQRRAKDAVQLPFQRTSVHAAVAGDTAAAAAATVAEQTPSSGGRSSSSTAARMPRNLIVIEPGDVDTESDEEDDDLDGDLDV